MGIVIAYVVYVTPWFKTGESSFPVVYYFLLIFIYGLHQVKLSQFLHQVKLPQFLHQVKLPQFLHCSIDV